MANTPEKILAVLEDTALLIRKAQINLKKCPKQRLTKGYIETRIKSIDEYWVTFKTTHNELIKCVPKEKRGDIPYFANEDYFIIEDLYTCIQADLADLLSTTRAARTVDVANTSGSSTGGCMDSPQVKLPQIQLPVFTGIYEEWPTFQDLFTSLVHNNNVLSKVQKLHYLKSSTRGEAESLLKHIQVTEANYEQAWDILKHRYGNKRLIINSLLKKLFFQKRIPSHTAYYLKSLLDTTNQCLNSLNNLNISIDSWDPIIIFLVTQKLDPESHREWEVYAYRGDSQELPKWANLMTFLESKFRTLELVSVQPKEKISKPKDMQYAVHTSTAGPTKNRICSLCKGTHTLSHCKEFIKMEPAERSQYVRTKNLCYNCLAPRHSATQCRLQMFCRVCYKRHHSLLHQSGPTDTEVSKQEGGQAHLVKKEEDCVNVISTNVTYSSSLASSTSTALLATALVPIRDDTRRTVLRALIDTGSQATFISERAAQILKVQRIPTDSKITGVGSTTTTVKYATQINILSRYDETFDLKVKAYIMPTRLTSQLPSATIATCTWPHLKNLTLADPGFNNPGRVDLLLGVEVCAQIMKPEIIKGPPGTPCAQNSSLGWILYGAVTTTNKKDEDIVIHHQVHFDNMIKQMWELENTEKRTLTEDERKCEEIYKETYKRNKEGRYIVKLPTKSENLRSTQGDTRSIALRRLSYMERRFEKNPKLKHDYTEVMEEYIKMKHMEEVPENEINKPAVYLPHQAVIREDKETTQLRVVFDASAKGKNNVSLNDELMVGPQLQEDMRNLIIRWRMKKVSFVADVQKMYRNILVTEEDRDYQRVLWRTDINQPVKDYRLLRVTFGTACAPYLATKTLIQIADDEGKDKPNAVKAIKEDFYMDDLMCGKDTLEEAIKTAKDIETILEKGGFRLQKWCSNDADFLKQFELSKISSHVKLDIKIDGTIRALGLCWNMGDDTLQYKYTLPNNDTLTSKITKRIILAEIQRLFDPLGWLAPALVPAKLLMQKIWLQGLSWDEEVDTAIRNEWLIMQQSFQHLNDIQIQRWLQSTEREISNVTVHGFCDASEKAYAAVAYMRVIKRNGEVNIGLIAAKTRVAPVKPVTLPRLELCGALLLANLLKQIREAMRLSQNQIFASTDSTIVLSWLFGDPARWQTFVRNRVVEIIDAVNNTNWYHVPTDKNPADVATRGLLLPELKRYKMWWNGPEFLYDVKLNYTRPNNLTTNLEKREVIHTNLKLEHEKDSGSLISQFKNYGTLKELLKTVIYCKRFLNYKKFNDKPKAITTEEVEISLNNLIRITQEDNFKEEIERLKEKKAVRKDSKLKTLQPYLDRSNIVRVGGRLRHANLDENNKHPIILDSKSHLTTLIVRDAHLKTLHGGVQLMMGYIRSKYWILKIKNIIKKTIRTCLICAKQNAAVRTQLMGDLPEARVTPARPFLNSGVDFAGPYQILMSKGRGVKSTKAYIAIFVCMATKATHLELVGDLTSESFIGAFRRFVARRGRCAHIWSDQGRNFVGANKELFNAWTEAKLEFGAIAESIALDGTQFHFIAAYSPHIGGLWEAGVKSLKHHLKRILTTHLTYEEMITLLCQIEACLNSRPLRPIDETDVEDIVPLTPGHFLIGEAPVTVPNPSLENVKVPYLSRWQYLQKLLSDLWHRWQNEYLSTLQQRPKWQKKNKEFDIGNIVLIKVENLPPGKWALGRIVDKHPGADGITRVYSVKSGQNIVRRTVNKLCPLPIDTED